MDYHQNKARTIVWEAIAATTKAVQDHEKTLQRIKKYKNPYLATQAQEALKVTLFDIEEQALGRLEGILK